MRQNDDFEEDKKKQHKREQWLLEAQAIFEQEFEKDLGSIDNPTQSGFVELARNGKDIWNTWREAYPEPEPNFSGIDFGSRPINFSGFHFPTVKDGRSCVVFDRANFGDRVFFRSAIFGDEASFKNAIFGKSVNFDLAKFGDNTQFNSAKFGNWSTFSRASFGDWTEFVDTTFGHYLKFEGASFGLGVHFSGACFGNFSQFEGVQFSGYADFSANTEIEAEAKTKSFYRISFAGANFSGDTIFTGRQFLSTTNFGPTRNPIELQNSPSLPKGQPVHFHRAPNFHDCKLHQDTNFDYAEFTAPPTPEAARAYRTLKLAMEKLKATREEQRFFRLEMKAEHPTLKPGKRWLSTLYSLFSDYGLSMFRPTAWLLSLSIFFGASYGVLADLCAADQECAKSAWHGNVASVAERTTAVLKYTLASAAPVPGLDKMQTELRAPLFGQHGWIAIASLTIEILHKIIAIALTFLFALALRNLFKMKS